jgi:hypothetical protein
MAFNFLENINIERLILEKIVFEYANKIPPHVLRELSIERLVDIETDQVKFLFRVLIPGREVRKEIVGKVLVYHSWWDYLKDVHFPKWLKSRYPAKSHWEPITIRHYHTCPHIDVGESNNREYLHINFLKGEEPEMSNWMKPFVEIAGKNSFGKDRKSNDD